MSRSVVADNPLMPRHLTPDEECKECVALHILQDVSSEHGVAVSEMLGRRRFPDLVAARREAIRRIERDLDLGPSAIGAIMGRHHSTIIYHLKP